MKTMLTVVILLAASLCFAEIGVIVFYNGSAISKDVYSGTTKNVTKIYDTRVAADPSLSYQVFYDTNVASWATFEATVVVSTDAAQAAIAQAKLDVKNTSLKIEDRFSALLLILGLR